MLGKKVAELLNGFQSEGKYRINYNAGDISSGIYFYKLSSDRKQLS